MHFPPFAPREVVLDFFRSILVTSSQRFCRGEGAVASTHCSDFAGANCTRAPADAAGVSLDLANCCWAHLQQTELGDEFLTAGEGAP
jgi:hypothetical protein